MNYTRHFECGCKIKVTGEITNAEIIYCPKHEAAPDMYEALKACHAANGCHNDEEAKLFDLVRSALLKAEGK